ncbi:MAG: hypothetical protein FWC64_03205 [Treponema sp.]|nr:hypothetical protein [Treponema sp.]
MPEKLVSMTLEEIRRVHGKDEAGIMAMAQAAPESDMQGIPELKDSTPGLVVARGFAQFREYINRKGRPKAESRKTRISIRLPEETVVSIREVEGYSTILGEYIMGGIKNGSLQFPKSEEAKSITP